jgi:hypothetical protein
MGVMGFAEEFAAGAVTVDTATYPWRARMRGEALAEYRDIHEAEEAVRLFRGRLALAVAAYHEEALRRALAGDCPVGDARLDQIRDRAAGVADGGLIRVDFGEVRDLLLALDFYRDRACALEGLLEDVSRDEGFERGRRQERAECLGLLRRRATEALRETERHGEDHYLARQRLSYAGGLEEACSAVAARGPAPEPLPGDRARARVKELEAELLEAREALASRGRIPPSPAYPAFDVGDLPLPAAPSGFTFGPRATRGGGLDFPHAAPLDGGRPAGPEGGM